MPIFIIGCNAKSFKGKIRKLFLKRLFAVIEPFKSIGIITPMTVSNGSIGLSGLPINAYGY